MGWLNTRTGALGSGEYFLIPLFPGPLSLRVAVPAEVPSNGRYIWKLSQLESCIWHYVTMCN